MKDLAEKSIDMKSINEHSVEIYQKLREFQNRRELIAKNHRILICGDYGTNLPVLETIRNRLQNDGYPAFLAKDLKKDLQMPDYDHTLMLMKDFDIILLVDGIKIGTGIDSGLIIAEGNTFQTKTIFLTNKKFHDIVNLSNPYIYYPMYEFWETHDDLIFKATELAKKESHRLAKIYLDKDKSNINSTPISK